MKLKDKLFVKRSFYYCSPNCRYKARGSSEEKKAKADTFSKDM